MDYATLVANGMTGTIIGSDLRLINKGAEIALHVSEEGIERWRITAFKMRGQGDKLNTNRN